MTAVDDQLAGTEGLCDWEGYRNPKVSLRSDTNRYY